MGCTLTSICFAVFFGSFYRHSFLFIVSSIFRLTEQLEVVSLSEIGKSHRSPRKMSFCEVFLNEHFRAVFRTFVSCKQIQPKKMFLKRLNVITEMVRVQRVTIGLWMHLGGLLSASIFLSAQQPPW